MPIRVNSELKLMDNLVIDTLAWFTSTVKGETLSLFLLLFCYSTILILWKLWNENGLYLYNILAVIVANIQVLKTTLFFFINEPVVLGTLLFATTFTVSDILTEHRGVRSAQLGVNLSFMAQLLMTILMIITLIYPVSDFKGADEVGNITNPVQYAIYILFVPSLRIFLASLTSYYICQFFDIYLFKLLKDFTNKKFLWLRFNISTMLAGLLDNIIFSILAWVILSPEPVTFHTLIFTYILGTYGSRILVSITSTPVIYLSYKFKKVAN